MRKPAFCICKNKGADQLYVNCAADQRLCFCQIDSTIPLLFRAEVSSILPFSAWLISDLRGKPEGRFSNDAAHIA